MVSKRKSNKKRAPNQVTTLSKSDEERDSDIVGAALQPAIQAALTANTDDWTGRTTENRYQIDIDTSVDAGADAVPAIRVYVAAATTTIYFDTSIGLS